MLRYARTRVSCTRSSASAVLPVSDWATRNSTSISGSTCRSKASLLLDAPGTRPGTRSTDPVIPGNPPSLRRVSGRVSPLWVPARPGAPPTAPGHVSIGGRGDGQGGSPMQSPAVPNWVTWRQAPAVVLYPQHLKKTATIALVVGTILFAI